MSVAPPTRVGINAMPLMSPLTGIGQYTLHLVRELQELLPENPWLFYRDGWSREVRTPPMPAAPNVALSVKRALPYPYRFFRYFQQRRFSAGARDHAIQLYHEPNFLAYRFAGPSVVTVHDLSWIRYPEMHPPDRVTNMNRAMPRVVREATRIVVDSEFIRAEMIAHYGLAPERVTTVLLGVPPGFAPLGRDACASVLASHALNYGEYLLAVGTLEPRKNLATVIAAFARLPEATRRRHPLVIVGMHGWGMERFSAQLRGLVSAGEVRLAGYLPQAHLPMLYSGARLFVYPSLYEGFGLPPLEAMACGVPVLASRSASLPEVVGDAGILVEALDEEAILVQMRALLEDDALRRRLSAAGLRRAAGFTWRRCAEETLEVYRKAMSASRYSS